MSKVKAKDPKKAVNLSLSLETIQKGRELQTLFHRPSLSNVIEFLIAQAIERRAQPANPNPTTKMEGEP